MKRLLLIEDNKAIQGLVFSSLRSIYQIEITDSAIKGEALATAGNFDLVLLDVGLPDGNGYHLCIKLRNQEETKTLPIIFLTGKGEVEDKIMGLTLGADDYVCKPFDINELRARIQSKLRRAEQIRLGEEQFTKGDLRINVNYQKVYLMKELKELLLDVTPIELKILVYFARHEDEVFDREHLTRRIWGDKTRISERAIDVHISHLRKKISESMYTITALHGEGYKFIRREHGAKEEPEV